MKNSLKKKSVIDELFTKGKRKVIYPLMIIELESEFHGYLVTVSKKKFKRAVDRNRIKRLMREALKGRAPDKAIGIIYLSNEMPESGFLDILSNV